MARSACRRWGERERLSRTSASRPRRIPRAIRALFRTTLSLEQAEGRDPRYPRARRKRGALIDTSALPPRRRPAPRPQRGLRRRARRRLPRRDRRARPRAQRLPPRHRRVRATASWSRSRTSSPPTASRPPPAPDPRGLRPRLRLDRRRPRQGRRPPDPRQDQHGRVRDGLVSPRTRPTGPPATLGHNESPRRLLRRLRGRRRRRARPGRSAPTPAAPSSNPPRSAASSASARPTAPSAATASSPSLEPRPGRAAHEDRPRLRPPLQGDRRP